MEIINFNDEISGPAHLSAALIRVTRQFLLYHKTRNVLFYDNALVAARKVSEVIRIEGVIDDKDKVQLDLFTNEVGKRGSNKNETYDEYWRDYFNR